MKIKIKQNDVWKEFYASRRKYIQLKERYGDDCIIAEDNELK